MDLEWYPVIEDVTWEDANKFLKMIEEEGWRFPTIPELVGIFDYRILRTKKKYLYMGGKIFWGAAIPDIAKLGSTDDAWAVSFEFGWAHPEPKGRKYNVRFVRDSKISKKQNCDERTRMVENSKHGEFRSCHKNHEELGKH